MFTVSMTDFFVVTLVGSRHYVTVPNDRVLGLTCVIVHIEDAVKFR